MQYQRIACQSQQLVENEEGQQVLGHSDTHYRAHAHSEGREVTGLFALLVAAHIADGIKVHGHPQHRSQRSENHTRRVGAQGQAHSISNLAQRPLVNIAI